MDDVINYNNFLNTNILHSILATNKKEALDLLHQNEPNIDAVTFVDFDKLLLYNVAVLHINRDMRYYFDYTFDKGCCDIVDKIKVKLKGSNDIKIDYVIDGEIYGKHEIDEFILVSARLVDFKIRITFLKIPRQHDVVGIQCRKYFLSSKNRTKFINNRIITNSFVYDAGLCIKRNHEPLERGYNASI